MVRLTDRPDMTVDVYQGRKTTTQQQQEDPLKSLHYEDVQDGLWSEPSCLHIYQALFLCVVAHIRTSQMKITSHRN